MRVGLAFALLLGSTFGALGQARAVELAPGDLLSAAAIVNDSNISVIRVDPETGDRVVISGPSGAGTIGSGPPIVRNSGRDVGLTYSGGVIWVSTSAGARYIRIDPDTGDRTIFSGCPTATGCSTPLIGAGPNVTQTWALVAVPELGVADEEFDALTASFEELVADVGALVSRIEALEASDGAQDAEIQNLRAETDAIQERLAAIEALPGIRCKLGKTDRRGCSRRRPQY